MANCDAAIDILKDKIIKKVTEKDVMKKLDKKKIPFEITVDNIKKNIKDIEKKDFLYALKQFIKIKQKSKGGSRSRKGGWWLSWFFYILCIYEETQQEATLANFLELGRCPEELEEMDRYLDRGYDWAQAYFFPAAAASARDRTFVGSFSASAASPAASSAASAASPAASPSAAVTYTPDSIGRMTMVDRQSIPSDIVDSWNGDDRYKAYTGPAPGRGGKKTYRKRKTKKRKKSRKRKSRKKRRKRKTKRKRSSRKRR